LLVFILRKDIFLGHFHLQLTAQHHVTWPFLAKKGVKKSSNFSWVLCFPRRILTLLTKKRSLSISRQWAELALCPQVLMESLDWEFCDWSSTLELLFSSPFL
jgi:hypothetical protein